MSEIIDKTYAFLDVLDNSELIRELTKYKNRLLSNKDILKEIERIKKETDNNNLILLRKKLYSNNDYKMYMKCYNELSLLVMKINKQYSIYTNTKE